MKLWIIKYLCCPPGGKPGLQHGDAYIRSECLPFPDRAAALSHAQAVLARDSDCYDYVVRQSRRVPVLL